MSKFKGINNPKNLNKVAGAGLALAIYLKHLKKKDKDNILDFAKYIVNKLIYNKITDKDYIYNYAINIVKALLEVSRKWLKPGFSRLEPTKYILKVSKFQSSSKYIKWVCNQTTKSIYAGWYDQALNEFGQYLYIKYPSVDLNKLKKIK